MQFVIESEHFQQLLDALQEEGYQVIGPTARDGAILYEDIFSVSDFPEGWTDEQDNGHYRLKPRSDQAWFGYTTGPQSWKNHLHPPKAQLWQAQRENGNFNILPNTDEVPRYAFIGVRSCELHAIAIQDNVFLNGAFVEPIYQKRREGLFVVAVNCGQAGGTCFCASMDTGPAVTSGYDLALTEMLEEEHHFFIVEVGTERGDAILQQVTHREASEAEVNRARKTVEAVAQHMGRQMDTTGLKEKLFESYEHPHWEAVAARCMTCGNCTMVCPTCFCVTVEDTTDLAGEHAERNRVWDSCFTMDFSYIHGGSVRYSPKARYRQWLTHKLAAWHEQFGTSGCVGCGRCITWCPVGIDLTAEVEAL
ncbi:MAG: 4Fe-4S dicluster domain-containing protein [Anaerolineae bacterium]|nr:4Fe-4S dicluster domain-containing protein [Anaerolineae bacterium]